MEKKERLALIGEITFRLEQFVAQVQEITVFPDQEKIAKLKEEIVNYAGSRQFAKSALRGHKETVGTLLINLLEIEDTFKKK